MVSPDDDTDRDWLFPDEPPSSTSMAVTLPAFDGVYRIDSQGEDATPFPSLIEATAEPPLSPEAEVRGPGGCLAQCHADRAAWAITQLGAIRIEREARARLMPRDVRRCSADRADFADEWAAESRDERDREAS